ncbi:MAG TPA: serine hydrolase domain-containing protein [Candidatus Cybelea sp.]|nr:serine hydrolase domain-containing protein [Candidatus Cybelea sp.]
MTIRSALVSAMLVATVGSAPRPPASALTNALDSYLIARVAHRTFSGVVLVARDDRVLFERAYGDADYEANVPNGTATIFRIASMTKPLVATAALALAARGTLRLDASICSLLDSCPPGWDRVTVANLLQLSSGIPDAFDRVAAVPPASLPDAVNAAIAQIGPEKLRPAFTPGSKSEYSNFDYLLLGYALARAMRESWLAVLQQTLLTPASMNATQYDDPWRVIPGRARGYRVENGELKNTKYEDDGALSAGGLLSTARDLLRFLQIFQTDRIAPAPLRAEALTPNAQGFGYGWQIAQFFGKTAIDFTGGTNGFSSNFSYYPADRLSVIVLSNIENAGAKGLSCDVGAIVHGIAPRNRAFSFAAVSAAAAASVAGTYASADGTLRKLIAGADGLTYQSSNSPAPQPLLGNGDRSYVLAEHPDVVIDVSSDAGQISVTSCGQALFTGKRLPA